MTEKKTKIAILGYGTVGSGVAQVLRENAAGIARRAGSPVEVAYILDLRDFPGDPMEQVLVHDFAPILQDPEVRIVVETLGGLSPAYDFTKQALQAGKSVCTSNKELVAEHGTELLRIAEEQQVHYLFEASCGGGIPIIRAINTSLTADEIDAVTGILNGTTNYILTKMAEDGSDFSDALREAQENGYAEKNPEADIAGHDAQRKLAILSSLAYGQHIDYRDIYTEGITSVTAADMRYAQALSARIKLLALSRKKGNAVLAMVVPALLDADNPLYAVQDVFNAILVHGNMLGDAMFYGSGAGSLPTASAVVADVLDCVKHEGKHIAVSVSQEPLDMLPVAEAECRFLVRLSGQVSDRLAEVMEVFGGAEPVTPNGLEGEFGVLTDRLSEADFSNRIATLPDVLGWLRVFF